MLQEEKTITKNCLAQGYQFACDVREKYFQAKSWGSCHNLSCHFFFDEKKLPKNLTILNLF